MVTRRLVLTIGSSLISNWNTIISDSPSAFSFIGIPAACYDFASIYTFPIAAHPDTNRLTVYSVSQDKCAIIN